jgi:phosphoribosyl 1,2-cyclic phosphodiesterase
MEGPLPLVFQSIRSSSSGNCLVLCSQRTTLLIDCGIRTQRDCDALIQKQLGGGDRVDAVLVSHAHSDHIGYAALRSLGRHGVAVYSHQHVVRHIANGFDVEEWLWQPVVRQFEGDRFTFGDMEIETMDVPHAPGCPNVGFIIRSGSGAAERKVVICTDFFDDSGVRDRFVDADFIFVEANHDPDLLRRHPNYASRFHMSNPKTGDLLSDVVSRSRRPPQAVMLGHLSGQRNTEELALGTVCEAFARRGIALDFKLSAAPKYAPSHAVAID